MTDQNPEIPEEEFPSVLEGMDEAETEAAPSAELVPGITEVEDWAEADDDGPWTEMHAVAGPS
jgi:hypothetical protein